ncbi:hypothetical protein [Lysinibacillus sp. Bpr_S20]|uniref:hypothetical protein n=1 Tax=Lysinibacillus sp. Bpr_S20 TaxID=2933964 RepID=UPI002012582B|nr:hypothetical protein [Lysinibacillus sp. Bpr_S20]MCL1699619.1 hypothetical protein [Lysinibacillus sp. Bpr_S20]
MSQTKKLFMCLISLIFLVVLAIPSLTSAAILDTNELSKDEVDALLSDSAFYQSEKNVRPATDAEFRQIADKVMEKRIENPNAKVDVKEILSELNLEDIGYIEEDNFNNSAIISPRFLAVGSVGFSNYKRTTSSFEARAHVNNSIPFTTIDQIWLFQRILNPTRCYRKCTSIQSIFKVPYGITKVTSLKSVPHFGYHARMEISAVVYDGGKSTTVSNRAISNPDGTFSQ